MTCRSPVTPGDSTTATIGGTVDVTGSVDSVPTGISVGINPLTISVTDAGWTLAGGVIATPDRRSLTVFNNTNQVLYFANDFFAALPAVGEDAFPIPANSNGVFACKQSVNIYLRFGTGGGSATVKGMEFY